MSIEIFSLLLTHTQNCYYGRVDSYDKREINKITLDKMDGSNFEIGAEITLWGCNMAGVYKKNKHFKDNEHVKPFTQRQLIEGSIANHIATKLNVKVSAFTGFSEAKTKNKDGLSPKVIDGEMIRTRDRGSQEVKLTKFKAGGGIESSPELKNDAK